MRRMGIALRFGAAAVLFVLIAWRLGAEKEPLPPPENAPPSIVRKDTLPAHKAAPIPPLESGPPLVGDAVTHIYIYNADTDQPVTRFELGWGEDFSGRRAFPGYSSLGWNAFETANGQIDVPWAELRQSGFVAVRAQGMNPALHRLPHDRDGLKGGFLRIGLSTSTGGEGVWPSPSDDKEVAGTGVIEGTVTVEGAPVVARISVGIYNIADDSHWSAATHADAAGTSRVDKVPPGQARLQVVATDPSGNRRQRSESFDFRVGEHVTRDVDFEAACTIDGTVSGMRRGESAGIMVITGSHDLQNVTEEDLYAFGGMSVAEGRARREDGSFSISGLEPGTYTVIALTENYQAEIDGGRDYWFTSTVVTLAPGVTESLTFRFD